MAPSKSAGGIRGRKDVATARARKPVLQSRMRNGCLWVFVKAKPSTGAVRDRFVFSDSSTTVQVVPPGDPVSGWLVVADDIEVLELFGPRAEWMAFAAADAFAVQADPLTHKLKDQGYMKKRRRGRRRRA